MSAAPRPQVAVVGAGVAGLAAAHALLARGDVEVRVYEATDRVGGVLRTSSAGGYLREHAANGFLSGAEEGAVALADALGVALEEASPAAKRRWIMLDGELRPLPGNPLEAITTDLISLRGKLRLLTEPLRRADPRAEESVFAFAERRLGSEIAQRIVAPMVTGIFAGSAREISLRAGFPELHALEEQGGLLRGMIAAARRRSPDQKNKRMRLHAPIAGVEALAEALAARIGDRFELGIAPEALEADGDRLQVRYPNGQRRRFDAVVLATPAYRAARMVAALSPPLAATLEEIPYAPAAMVHLGFDRADIVHPLDGFGFIVAEGEPLRLLGCVFESVLWPNRAPSGKVLLRCIFGGTRDPAILDLRDDELVEVALNDLRRTIGVTAEPVHRHVVRWPRAIPQYTAGHVDRVERADDHAQPLGIVLAGSAYRGVAVNRCVADAGEVLSRVLARLRAIGALAALLLLVTTLIACGGNRKALEEPASDGGEVVAEGPRDAGAAATPPGAAPPYRLGPHRDGRLIGGGSAEISVSWDDAPAALRRSPGIDECGDARRPPVSIHTLGGLRQAVVELEGVTAGRAPDADAPVELAIVGCRFAQPMVRAPRLGAILELANLTLRAQRVTVERWGASPEVVAEAPLPLIGHRRTVALDEPGIWRVQTAAAPESPSWVIVPAHPYVAVTDDRGVTDFEEVPAGRYRVRVWVPPLQSGGEPLAALGELTVAAGERVKQRIAIAKRATDRQ